jgi:hypothetical protein
VSGRQGSNADGGRCEIGDSDRSIAAPRPRRPTNKATVFRGFNVGFKGSAAIVGAADVAIGQKGAYVACGNFNHPTTALRRKPTSANPSFLSYRPRDATAAVPQKAKMGLTSPKGHMWTAPFWQGYFL